MSTLDRDAAREAIYDADGIDIYYESQPEALLDALEGCVRPASAQIIDRDELARIIFRWFALAPLTEDGSQDVSLLVRDILALLRPVDGNVTLTRDEAVKVLQWKRVYDHKYGSDVADDALHGRLEAAS